MVEPIKKSVKARRHSSQYQMHKYFARRPYNVFNNLISHYSKEGDIVLDIFSGGGVTIFEGLSLNRKTIGVDINPLATFITEMQIQQVDLSDLEKYFYSFFKGIEDEFSDFYRFRINGHSVEVIWTEWVYEVYCEECNHIIRLSNENKISNGRYKCLNSNCKSNKTKKNGVSRTKCKPFSSFPTRLKYKDDEGNTKVHELSHKESQSILDKEKKYIIPNDKIQVDYPIPENWDRWYEDCLPQKGIYTFSGFFTRRNYYINTLIFNKILELPDSSFKDILYFSFSSSLRYTNNMSRVSDNWENGNPTSMDKHAYWLPNVYVECNILDRLESRMKATIKGLLYTNETMTTTKTKAEVFEELKTKDYMILTQSASELPIPDEQIDVIITDPPYGSNVQYGELSSFWNVWYMKYKNLDNFIYNDKEAVSNRKMNFEGAKDVNFYGEMLKEVFTEANRVLKPNGYLVFTFNNKNINVWIQMLWAVVKSGFYLPKDGVIYQDFIEEYKNTSHLRYSGNVHGDFIYSFKKGKPEMEIDRLNCSLEEALKDRVGESLNLMYTKKSEYTTTELHQEIYSNLINVFITYLLNDTEENFKDINSLPNTFVDDRINEKLVMKDQKWILREEG